MRAARIDTYGGPEALHLVEVDEPTPGPGQVLIEVHGSSINPGDLALRSGWLAQFLPVQPPLTLGMDVAGLVVSAGSEVTGFEPGDAVFGVAGVVTGGSGAFAERALATPGTLAAPPQNVDLSVAGTLALAGVSALQAIETLRVGQGTRLLVLGAAGAVGQFAVGLAEHLGAEVFGAARDEGVKALEVLDVRHVIDTGTTDLSSLRPFDATLDLIGIDPMLPVQLTRERGRTVSLLLMPSPELADRRRITASRQATTVTSERLRTLADFVERGILVPRVEDSYPLSEIARAFDVKAVGGIHGKIAIALR